MRICILTPGPLGSNPRVVKEAGALAEAGHDVTTISTRTLASTDRRDAAIMEKAPWRAQRLDFRARGNGWRLRRIFQIGRETAFSLTGFDRFADRAISPFAVSLAAAATALPADLYVAHYPAALPAAAIAARTHGASYAYDAEDFHPGDWPDDRHYDRKRNLVRSVEGRYLKRCAYVTAASPGIADAYAATYGIARPAVLLNVFPLDQAPTTATPCGIAVPGPSIYWFSQTIGPDRGLEAAVQALGRARTRPHLYLRGNPAPGFIDRLRSIAESAGAADRLHVLTPESPLEMVRLAAAYDAGLSSETGQTHNRRIALNNKLFTYILAGIPVLMSDIPAHRALASEMGQAARLYTCDDAGALAVAIDTLLGDKQALAEARAAAFHLGQTRFNWDREKSTLHESGAAVFRSPLRPHRIAAAG